MGSVRIAVVSDIHAGPDIKKKYGCKLGTWAPVLLPQFVAAANDWKADFTVNLGDTISAKSPYKAKKYKAAKDQISSDFAALNMPLGNCMGNHCERLGEKLNSPKDFPPNVPSEQHLIHGVNIVIWNPNANVWTARSNRVAEDHIKWLENALDSDTPTLLFSHVPFEEYKRENTLNALIAEKDNVLLCVHGHKHIDRFEIRRDMPPVLVQQSLTERMPDSPFPWGAYALIEIDDEKIRIERRNLMTPCAENRVHMIQRDKTQGGLIQVQSTTAPACESI